MATESQETSAVVRDLIHTSELISKGPPSRYRLLTSRSNLYEDGSVRKWTFGQRCVNMENKILLMVGETGTGKTTLINVMINYILGVKFTDEVWFEITEEGGDHHMSDQTKSQTTEITVYEVFVKDNPICLTIIDTPGYGDTRGVEYDKQTTENLFKLFQNSTGVKEIDAVCLVLKASENQLSHRQLYIFDAVLSLFGKDIESNIVIFITHSDGLTPYNVLNVLKTAGIPCRKNEKDEPGHFLFNNHHIEERRPEYNKALQAAWDLTEDSFKYFFTWLKEPNRKSLEQSKSMRMKSKQLEACISNLQKYTQFIACTSTELAQVQRGLWEDREKIKRNENLTFTVTNYHKEKVSTANASRWDINVTSCSVCMENCHEYGCWNAPDAWWCYVMKNEHCTVCTGKCHYTKHVRENKKYVTRATQITMAFNDLKMQCESNKKPESDQKFDLVSFENVRKEIASSKREEEEKLGIEQRLKNELARSEREKVDLVNKAYNTILKLSEIALKTDSTFIVQSLDFLIPRAEETRNVNCAQKLRKLRRIQPESEERVHAAMGYARAGLNKLNNFVTGK